MVPISSWMHSTFKELSNEYSHTQIRVKTKKLWPRQVREEKPVAVQIWCRDKLVSQAVLRAVSQQTCVASCVASCVATNLCRELCRDKPVSRPACCVATNDAAET